MMKLDYDAKFNGESNSPILIPIYSIYDKKTKQLTTFNEIRKYIHKTLCSEKSRGFGLYRLSAERTKFFETFNFFLIEINIFCFLRVYSSLRKSAVKELREIFSNYNLCLNFEQPYAARELLNNTHYTSTKKNKIVPLTQTFDAVFNKWILTKILKNDRDYFDLSLEDMKITNKKWSSLKITDHFVFIENDIDLLLSEIKNKARKLKIPFRFLNKDTNGSVFLIFKSKEDLNLLLLLIDPEIKTDNQHYVFSAEEYFKTKEKYINP